MTSSNTAITPRLIEARTIAFDVLAEHNPDPWSPAVVTDAMVDEAYDRVKHLYSSRRGGKSWVKTSIRKWLDNPSTYDPHVDEIAVERAMALDHSAYVNLSEVEGDIVRGRLAEMPDPWGWGADLSSDDASMRSTAYHKATSPRSEQWLSWPVRDRQTLQDAVNMRRIRAGRSIPKADRQGSGVEKVRRSRTVAKGKAACCAKRERRVLDAKAEVATVTRRLQRSVRLDVQQALMVELGVARANVKRLEALSKSHRAEHVSAAA